ncbi:DUF4065 domain-containing protein [Ramlibacter sp. RBP-2]|uniref:DUF4065 domain-containing protein n=1 Tax=Ramlibacter lithotrophicus TaxID=2606681 RepID=A0A7X6DL04_9BURK|nr:Panacea domain-containing protein [Ramlibacter lithotrophicus]NKE69119.1 DUF4065 domain-containing protein [Ramlibacter lithotrophicus]
MEKLNRTKFKALVHYICQKAEDPSCLGAIKLNKVLWYSDSIFFKLHGQSITGETYVKRQFGPVPRDIVGVIDELVAEGKIARGRVDHFGHLKSEFIAIEEADVSQFTGPEIQIIDEAFEHVCINNTAKSISEETHGVIWQIAAMGEPIPLATVFASEVGEVDEDDLAWARGEVVAGA